MHGYSFSMAMALNNFKLVTNNGTEIKQKPVYSLILYIIGKNCSKEE